MNSHFTQLINRSLKCSIRRGQVLFLLLAATALFSYGLFSFLQTHVVRAAGQLSVEIIGAYNYVVDSNVESPSTYAPSVATIGGRFCNTGDAPLTNVHGMIGDYSNGSPGLYPARDSDSDAAFQAQHPHLANTGAYAFTHIGGRAGLDDATRYIGTIDPDQCKVQYWHMTYPRRANPDNSGVPVWGETNDPDDDLWLEYDIWATSTEGTSANTTRRATMRNEISALANKIEPQGGRWFNTDTTSVRPGQLITSNGVLYSLGNINKGFDNDGDGDYDYNAWLQPIGDPSYDPSCFRLVRTSGVITVSRSSGNPDLIIPFADQLYFTDLPADNTGARGNVHYTFMALNGPCTTALSPYQEVASGADNEKFNGDYGVAIPPVQSQEAQVTLGKTTNPVSAAADGTDVVTYTLDFNNDGSKAAGLPFINMGLTLRDSIPVSTTYLAGSADYSLSFTPNSGVTILYSTDNGGTWSVTEPVPASDVTDIQWWLNDPLPGGESGTALFAVTVDAGYSPPAASDAYVENVGQAGFGTGPSFAEDNAITMIIGPNRIGDRVWQDDDGDGAEDAGESGIADVTVQLYLDRDGNGALDAADPLITSSTTSITGTYYFENLPDGDFLVQVDESDSDLPFGYSPTTDTIYAVTLAGGDYLNADFGFGPSLSLDKTLLTTPALEGNEVAYRISLTNLRPGDGSGQPAACTYDFWAATLDSSNNWTNPNNAFGASGPDGSFASLIFSGNADSIQGSGPSVNNPSGNITAVEVIYSLYVDGTLNDDDATGNLDVGVDSYSQYFSAATLNNFGAGLANQGELVWDVTGLRGWTWADLQGSISLDFTGQKQSNSDNVALYLDAMGIRVTTDEMCGGSDDTINPAPLTDTYDADRLQFVSATPSASNVTFSGTPYANTGTISWDNVGPLYAGQTRFITVTFTSQEPPDNDSDGENDAATITNTASVSGATFLTGQAANNAQDEAVTTLIPTGSIGDIVWNDNGAGGGTGDNGIQDGGEQGIPGVVVGLYDSSSTLVLAATTTVTGYYHFVGLTDDTYTIVVDTSSLPGSTFIQTADPDEVGACSTCDDSGTTTLNNSNGNASDDDDDTIDFGYQVPNTVYGNVWEDNSGNGWQESGENGLAGIVVELLDGTCTPGTDCATTTTDANGDYVFSDLPDGTYQVLVNTSTLPAAGSWTQTADPDATFDDRTTSAISVSGGNVYGSYDFAYTQSDSSSIGDTVYTDWNGDGDQDTGEEGISGVTVTLYEDANGDGIINTGTDAVVLTATTTITGYYHFDNLPAGDFIVVVDESDLPFPLAGYQETQDPDEADVCIMCDSQGSVTTDGGSDQLGIDFGYQPVGTGSIGDTVWQDDDRDGIQDSGEVGLANILLSLYEDSNGNGEIDVAVDALVLTATTDADGSYLFENLPAGDYLVDVDTADTDLPNDGYGNPYVLSTSNDPLALALTDGQAYTEADFGFTAGGTIGDLVWSDDNRNGTPDTIESGIAAVTVSLHTWIDVDTNGIYSATVDTLGPLVMTTTTDASGTYLFSGLPADDYVVVVDTGDPDLPNSTMTFDPDAEFDAATGVELSAGQIYYGADFGFAGTGVIGDALWIDLDDDSVYDLNEVGIAGVEIQLTNSTGAVVTTTTDNDGYYLFPDLAGDTYTVTVETADLPAGLVHTFEVDSTLDHSVTTALASGATNLTIDFGYVPDLSLTKTSSSGGSPIHVRDTLTYTIVVANPSSVSVTGIAISDTLPAHTNYVAGSLSLTPATAGSGGSPPPVYMTPLTVTANSALTVTFQVTITDPLPSGVNAITNTAALTTTFGITDTDTVIDTLVGDISGQVRDDTDADGDLADADTGISGATIVLWSDPNEDGDPGDGVALSTTTTDAGGTYTFTNVALDSYVIVETDPAGYNSTADIDGGNDNQIAVTLTGSESTGNDFLDTQLATLGNFVWHDLDADGIQDAAEPGLAGVMVELFNDGVSQGTTTTDASGLYTFTNVVPGDYYLIFTAPAGYVFSPPDQGADDAMDSDADATGQTITVTLNSGDNDTTWDTGLSQTATVGDFAWHDLDADGVQDVGEPGLAGVAVNLYDSGNTLVMTTTTDSSGAYTFTGLAAGDYVLEFVPPSGYAVSPQDQGGDDTVDSDADPANGQTAVFTLAAGESNLTWDAAFFPVVADVVIDKDVSTGRIAPNQVPIVTYTLTVTNVGNVPLNSIYVTDILPAGLSYAGNSSPSAPTVSGQTLTWSDLTNGADLAPNDSIQITFEVSVTTTVGTYVNQAQVTAASPPGHNYPGTQISGEDDIPLTVEDPSIALNKEVAAPGMVNGVITFTIQITNTGPSAIDLLPLHDVFTGPVEYIGGTPTADMVDNDNGLMQWDDLTTSFGNLQPNQAITITTVFRVTSGESEISMMNEAQVRGAEDEYTNPTNEPQDDVPLSTIPTAVELSSFTAAHVADKQIEVEWVTESEIDNFGFRLYRSPTASFDAATEIHFQPSAVPGGNGPGTSYSYSDNVPGYGTWHYWLVDVETGGTTTTHGPISINVTRFHLIYLPFVSR